MRENTHQEGPDPIPETTILDAAGDAALPEMGVIEQVWETDPIPPREIAERAATAVDEFDLDGVPTGGSVAIGAGSRGIANIASIVHGVVTRLGDLGYEPFVFPAMGSHGGAVAEGQREMLNSLDMNEATLGCEIRATMETVVIGETAERDIPVHVDANAAGADAIVPINRIKPHTDFQGDVESGLSKMLVIGMGKQRGAKTAHKWAADWSLRNMIPEIASRILDKLPVIGGVAVVEDEHDETDVIEGVPPSGFLDREAELLNYAYDRMPTLPFDEIDTLVVDRQGKDVSGSGMDTNVIGRMVYGFEPEPQTPSIKRIFVRGLTEVSHGNATAVGSADVIHADLYTDIDLADTFVNALTSSTIAGARIPAPVETDRAGLVVCLSTIGVTPPSEVQVARIRDTMHLERIEASTALVEAARERDDLRVVEEPSSMQFDDGQFERNILDP
ncbi:LOW QUALITY PROTEIN: iron-sulfur cluster binding protein [Halarchaeum acidiphilum MH1-52-1]|uniref:Iron-sulfur cluster binding protein n=2 Tax=Halarchaeum acidiphilum TaxID=489138 RepID=U3A5F1_9EURY|nr:hypothetical protein [Halarchaeum acidiphilum]GAD52854.1 LOW QUALITY PROTEIN: iron-sulfur cluster binding protein [Halarchaeum acidiphilum MH1-52-1]